jgi:glycerophosphoryl diester phosphodiesterase
LSTGSGRGVTGVEVVAHRGASADAPEHTLAAYRQAVRLGADAVECDVRMTGDGVLVCVHDRRVDRASSGRGAVSALSLVDLEELHFRARGPGVQGLSVRSVGEAVPVEVVDEEAGRVLTLDRLLEYVTSTPGQVRLAIETKHPTRHSGRVEVALLETLRRFGLVVGGGPVEWSGRPAVHVMSFSSLALRRLRVLAPELPAVHLVNWIPPRGGTTPPSAITAVGASISLLRRYPGYVARVQSADKEVHVWTVNEERDIDLVLSLGVDAVITDRPGEVLRRLGRTLPATGQRPVVSRQPTSPGQEWSGG